MIIEYEFCHFPTLFSFAPFSVYFRSALNKLEIIDRRYFEAWLSINHVLRNGDSSVRFLLSLFLSLIFKRDHILDLSARETAPSRRYLIFLGVSINKVTDWANPIDRAQEAQPASVRMRSSASSCNLETFAARFASSDLAFTA